MSSAARERRDAMVLLLAVAFVTLPHATHLPLWTSALIAMLWSWRAWLTLANRSAPGHVAMLPLLLLAGAAVWLQYRTLLGQEAGVTLLLLLLALKLLELRATRDVFVVVFLCFFVLLTQYLFGQTLIVAGLTAAAALSLFFVLVSISLRDHDLSAARKLRTVGWLAFKALPLTALLFVLFPRLNTPLWGLPHDAFAAKSGLSDAMSPGNINRLLNSDAIAFRVQFDGPAPRNDALYWRGPVLGHFDGRTWTALSSRGLAPPRFSIRADPASRVRHEVTLEPTRRDWLFALEMPVEVPTGGEINARFTSDGRLLNARPPLGRVRYSVDAFTRFSFGTNETPRSLRDWLALPAGFNPRAMQFAQDLRSRVPSGSGRSEATPALVAAVLEHFRTAGFRYTLEPPLLGQHSVDEFLFDTKLGYCEFYASAFVFLMRAMDIPARVVTGYQGGEVNPVDGFFTVRQSDAHAWAEVWHANSGWVRIDPTAVVAPVRIQSGTDALQRSAGVTPLFSFGASDQSPVLLWLRTLRFGWEAIENRWNQWVISYSAEQQYSLLQRFGIEQTLQALGLLLAVAVTLAITVLAIVSLRHRTVRDPLADLDARFRARLEAAGLSVQPADGPQRLGRSIERRLAASDRAAALDVLRALERLRYAQGGANVTSREIARLRWRIARLRFRLAD